MQKKWSKTAAFAILLSLLVPVSLLAQDENAKKEAEKAAKDKKDMQQIIITRKGDKADKIVVEINGDNVLINGKPLDEYKDKNGDLTVKLGKLKDLESLSYFGGGRSGVFNFNNNSDNNMRLFTEDANRAMLGVTTEKTAEGAEVQDITKESAAEKIGLKENDIITKIGDKKIEGPDDLSEAIKAYKPGDKVTVTFLRDKKEQKATAELTKWKGMNVFGSNQPFDKMDLGNLNLDKIMPKMNTYPRTDAYGGQNWSWSGGSPKLGLSVQDTDDGKGVKVIDVDNESNAAKAGIKEDDIITQVDDKAVNGADEIAKLLREKKENPTVRFQISRGGKTQTIEVKMPRKIKTADL